MLLSVTQASVTEIESPLIIVPVAAEGVLSLAAEEINQASEQYIEDVIALGDFTGKKATSLLLPKVKGIKAERLLLIGTGAKADKTQISNKDFIKIADKIASEIKQSKSTGACIFFNDVAVEGQDKAWQAEQVAIALEKTQYAPDRYKTQDEDKPKEESISNVCWLVDEADAEACHQALSKGQSIGQGINTAKELGDLPGNICTPSYLAEQAEELAKNYSCIETQIISEAELEAMGAGAFVSVSKGSIEDGKFIIMKYQGAKDANEAPHMLLGKGITFDTGGISLKPGAGMDEMKYDMCGAASVMGTMKAIAQLQPEANIIGMITSAENMPAGNASKPGDIVTTLSGQTVEILNTDAEGRLVLCDALTYGIENFKPASIVDIATLTGACMMALGGVNSGLFTENESLANELENAATHSRDSVWRLPLQEEYQELLDSNFADMANIGGRLAGATTAACFLSRFTKDQVWAHVDIAGTAWNSGGKNKGATGRPVALLTNYLLAK